MNSFDDASVERVLVLALERLGDTLQALPTVQALRERFPGARVDLLANATYAPALHASPAFDRFVGLSSQEIVACHASVEAALAGERAPIPVMLSLAAKLRGERYDFVVNIGMSTLGAWLSTQASPRASVGLRVSHEGSLIVDGPAFRYFVAFLDFRDENPFNLVDLWRASVARPGQPSTPRAYVAAASEVALPRGARVVAINPWASREDRRWPASHFARVADALADEGVEVVLVGGPADVAGCEAVRDASASRPAIVTDLSVPAMAGWFSEIGCVVANDTGALHVAAGVGARVVGLYGGFSRARETAPFVDGALLLEARELREIDVESVVAAVRVQLRLENEQAARTSWSARSVDVLRSRIETDRPDSLGGVRYEVLASRPAVSDAALCAHFARALALETLPGVWLGFSPSHDRLVAALASFGPSAVRSRAGEALGAWGSALHALADAWIATSNAADVTDEAMAKLLVLEADNLEPGRSGSIAMLSRVVEWDLKMIMFEDAQSFGAQRAAALRSTSSIARAWASALSA